MLWQNKNVSWRGGGLFSHSDGYTSHRQTNKQKPRYKHMNKLHSLKLFAFLLYTNSELIPFYLYICFSLTYLATNQLIQSLNYLLIRIYLTVLTCYWCYGMFREISMFLTFLSATWVSVNILKMTDKMRSFEGVFP